MSSPDLDLDHLGGLLEQQLLGRGLPLRPAVGIAGVTWLELRRFRRFAVADGVIAGLLALGLRCVGHHRSSPSGRSSVFDVIGSRARSRSSGLAQALSCDLLEGLAGRASTASRRSASCQRWMVTSQ